MIIIASDGATFEPVTADTLYFISGERYDFVLNADKNEVKDYWVRVRALPPCTKEIEEFAIVRYHKGRVPEKALNLNFNDRKPPGWLDRWPDKRLFNSPQPDVFGTPVSSVESFVKDNSIINAKPDHSFTLFINTPQLNNEVLFSGDNSIKFMGLTETNF